MENKTKQTKEIEKAKPIAISKEQLPEPQEKLMSKPQQEILNPYNVVESAKIGELYLQSEVIRADDLLRFIVGALQNPDVKKYLGLVERKKSRGNYLG